jgi:aminopeptidase N
MRFHTTAVLLVILLTTSLCPAADDDWPLVCGKRTAADFNKALTGDVCASSCNYNVLRYGLHIVLGPEAEGFTGSLKMEYSANITDLQQIVMDASNLEITAVTGREGAMDFVAAGDSLVIDLPLLKAGTMDSLRVEYRGAYTRSEGLTYNMVDRDDATQGYAIASFSEPEFARTWWPCKDRPGDKALVDTWVTAPAELVVVSNGVNLGREDHGDGTATTHWREDHPISPYLVSIAVADYEFLGETCNTLMSGSVPIMNWVLARNLADAAIDFAPTCDMIRFMEELAGPYRFADEKYGHAEVLNFTVAAMEHQTVTSWGYGMLRGDNFYDWVVIHELAHQWFGDSLSPSIWADIWLNEGFARYFEVLWIEENEGVEAYHDKMRYLMSGDGWESSPQVYDSFPILHSVVYNKGAWILHMLRGRLGDDDFFELLHRWANEDGRPYDVVSTEEFITLANTYTSDDLHDFFDPWLHETTTPKLDVDWVTTSGAHGENTRLEMRLTDLSGVDFDNIFPLKVTTAAGVDWVPLHMKGSTLRFTQDFSHEIQSVELDPDHWVAWRLAGMSQPSLLIKSISPNPAIGGEVRFTITMEEGAPLQLEIFDVMGRRVAERRIDIGTAAFQETEVVWDGRNASGQSLASGVYWARFTGNGQEAIRKFTLID